MKGPHRLRPPRRRRHPRQTTPGVKTRTSDLCGPRRYAADFTPTSPRKGETEAPKGLPTEVPDGSRALSRISRWAPRPIHRSAGQRLHRRAARPRPICPPRAPRPEDSRTAPESLSRCTASTQAVGWFRRGRLEPKGQGAHRVNTQIKSCQNPNREKCVKTANFKYTLTPIPPKLFTEMTERADFTNKKQQ